MSSQATVTKPFTTIAALFFALVAIGHVLRLVFAVEVVIGGVSVPLGVSFPVAMIAAGLAFLIWRESHA